MNFTTTHIRSEKVTIDTRIYTILNGRKKPGEVYLAAIAPDMELTIITLDEAPGILPCFEEDDACLNLPNTYNPAQVLEMGHLTPGYGTDRHHAGRGSRHPALL